ncbi:MAG TPA: DUF86 domain-containing protein [Chitinophagaceae bacterium]|nr:DUF86 domain-containing protein [Chitinophagaceae bacterium]
MPDNRSDILLVNDIFLAMQEIFLFIQDMAYVDFIEDPKTKAAVVRNLEIIGEAAKLVSEETKLIYKLIEWKEMTALRNKLIHDYFGIDYEIVWSVIQEDIPHNYELVKKLLSEK